MKIRSAFILAVMTLMFASCNVTDPYVKTKLNGIWVLAKNNDQRVATENRNVFYLTDKSKAVLCNKSDKNVWQEQDVKWTFEGIALNVGGVVTGDLQVVNDTMLLLSSDAGSLQYNRVVQIKSPYLGTWEVIDDTNTDNIGKVRLVFTEDGKYEYQTLTDGAWSTSGLKSGDWYVYETFLALNSIESSGTTAELWDISLAYVNSETRWLQNATDKDRNILRSRTLKKLN